LTSDRLAGKIALVSGAANGIGRASALRLAREGADLVVVDREGDPLQKVAAVHAAFATARRALSRIDILFNNVGQSARERATEFHLSQEETWRFVVDVSLLTTMRATREVVEEMRTRRSGRIVNMS